MAAADEAEMGGQRRRMRRLEHEVALAIDQASFLLRVAPPEQEHEAVAFAVERIDAAVREAFPTLVLMGAGEAMLDREHGIEQQHALFRPRHEAAVVGARDPEVA